MQQEDECNKNMSSTKRFLQHRRPSLLPNTQTETDRGRARDRQRPVAEAETEAEKETETESVTETEGVRGGHTEGKVVGDDGILLLGSVDKKIQRLPGGWL